MEPFAGFILMVRKGLVAPSLKISCGGPERAVEVHKLQGLKPSSSKKMTMYINNTIQPMARHRVVNGFTFVFFLVMDLYGDRAGGLVWSKVCDRVAGFCFVDDAMVLSSDLLRFLEVEMFKTFLLLLQVIHLQTTTM